MNSNFDEKEHENGLRKKKKQKKQSKKIIKAITRSGPGLLRDASQYPGGKGEVKSQRDKYRTLRYVIPRVSNRRKIYSSPDGFTTTMIRNFSSISFGGS